MSMNILKPERDSVQMIQKYNIDPKTIYNRAFKWKVHLNKTILE